MMPDKDCILKTMYKKVLKSIKDSMKQYDLYKSDKYNHPIHGRKPHFIFSAENPYYPSKLDWNHDKVIEFLEYKGYNVENLTGKYGGKERSILVHEPSKKAIKHLKNLAASLGQESSIVSDGYKHEMHYHNGDNAGKHHKGQGTANYKVEPEDFYSTLEDGTHFSHNFDHENLYKQKDSDYKEKESSLKKSERFENYPFLSKSEDNHPLSKTKAGRKLIHYSNKEGLEKIDPQHLGTGIRGSNFRAGKPETPWAHYYLEDGPQEDHVLNNNSRKYVVSLGGSKLYDISKDKDGVRKIIKEKSGRPNIDFHDYVSAVKDHGYDGFYASNTDYDFQGNTVHMFDSLRPEAEYGKHKKDYKKASSKDFNGLEEHRNRAESFASENGHHSPAFLHKLSTKIKEES